MTQQTGAVLVLSVEKPAAGGRMIARHEGEVILVSGTLPGERVRVRIDRVGRGVAYASTIEVLEASPDRRPVIGDPSCGGQAYVHVARERQLALKAEVVADAFTRIARITPDAAIPVTPSPDLGYRMRARLHVRAGVIGFFREGTHDLCDPAGTGQLLPETTDLLARLSYRLRAERLDLVSSIELSENIPASERVLHLETTGAPATPTAAALFDDLPVTGVSASPVDHPEEVVLRGTPTVTDVLHVTGAGGVACAPEFTRHVRAFFQANRFLLPALVSRVLALVPPGPVVDLYAGVGVFAVSLAAAGWSRVTAVEGDRVSAGDLRANARPWGSALQTHAMPVERFFLSGRLPADSTIILDPPRTGMSREAAAGVIASGAARVVCVSCDVATLARDVHKLAEAGYTLDHLEAFDLFPNTAHVEALAVLTRKER